MSMNDTERGKL